MLAFYHDILVLLVFGESQLEKNSWCLRSDTEMFPSSKLSVCSSYRQTRSTAHMLRANVESFEKGNVNRVESSTRISTLAKTTNHYTTLQPVRKIDCHCLSNLAELKINIYLLNEQDGFQQRRTQAVKKQM